MPRILGVDLPNGKPTYISLSYLKGIGQHSAIRICDALGINPHLKANALNEDQVAQLAAHIDSNFVVEAALNRQTQSHIARLREIKCYRGIRHRLGLPVRGQNTQTNARTRKGAKKTVAGKKGVKDLK